VRYLGWLTLVAASLLTGCRHNDENPLVPGASIAAGRAAIQQYNCGVCHQIRGISGADGMVGPPLSGIVRRTLIGGELPNNVANLSAWIRDPQAIEPRSGMPNLGVDSAAARNIVAYLYTLR
jgi:cytochrome c2